MALRKRNSRNSIRGVSAANHDSRVSLKAIAARLRAIRFVFGDINQRQACVLTGIDHVAWNNWEQGKMRPLPEHVWKIKRAFGVGADWIYFGDPLGLPPKLVKSLTSALRNAG